MMQDIASSPSPDDSQTAPPPSPAAHDIPHFLALLDQLRLAIPPPDCPPSATPLNITKPLLLLHALRPLHRSIHLQLDERRAYLQRLYRRGVDGLNIERASWQYEKDWFLREIERQRQYVSTEKEIELISEDDFRRKRQQPPHAHTSMADDPDAPTDRNQLHIARLQDELAERKRLLAQVEQLQQRKAQLQQSNAAQRQNLTSLTTTLTSLYQSTSPLYATFFPSADEQPYRPLPDKAQELPAALWQLFCVGWSYCAAFVTDDSVTIEVVEVDRKDWRRDEKGKERSKEKDKDSVWATHPLSVLMRLRVGAAASVDLRFSFLPALHLVSVLPAASPSSTAADYSSLLHELYPGDDGSALQTQHLSSLSPAVQQSVRSLSPAAAVVGHLYVWCQRLCGLHPIVSAGYSQSTADASLADMLLIVRQRLEQRPVIEQQLQRYQLSAPSTSSSLTASSRVYTRQYAANGGRVLSVEVELHVSYPVHPPRFTLRSTSGGSIAMDERKLRALESDLNSADKGTDVLALSRLMDQLERQWPDCV